jgi:SAM-dependent methyltransferase
VDLSPGLVERARERFPQLRWLVQDAEALELDQTFDYVILSDLLGHLEDIGLALQQLHAVWRPDSRVVITYYNYVWEPLLIGGQGVQPLGASTDGTREKLREQIELHRGIPGPAPGTCA